MNAPFSPEALTILAQALLVMLEGMTGIFVFMAVFYGIIVLLDRIFREKPTKEV